MHKLSKTIFKLQAMLIFNAVYMFIFNAGDFCQRKEIDIDFLNLSDITPERARIAR